MATDIPATMMVLLPVPSHTMRSGARADFGRLFSTTRKGSVIFASFTKYQNKSARKTEKNVTKIKLTRTSSKVILV